MLIRFFRFFLSPKRKTFHRTVCNPHPQNSRNNLYPKEKEKWAAPSAPASMTTHSTRQMCWFFNQNRAAQTSWSTRLLQSGSGLSVCRGLSCQMEALSVLQPLTLWKQRSWSENGCFKNNEKCPLKLLSVLFARSRWTSVALRPILDYVLTNQHSADSYIICF